MEDHAVLLNEQMPRIIWCDGTKSDMHGFKPSTEQITSNGYMSIDLDCKGGLNTVTDAVSNTLDNVKEGDVFVMYPFFNDFVQRSLDSSGEEDEQSLYEAVHEVDIDIEMLVNETIVASSAWKQEVLGLKVVWVLPPQFNFFEVNNSIAKDSKDPLSTREVQKSKNSSKIYESNLLQFKNLLLDRGKNIQVLDLQDIIECVKADNPELSCMAVLGSNACVTTPYKSNCIDILMTKLTTLDVELHKNSAVGSKKSRNSFHQDMLSSDDSSDIPVVDLDSDDDEEDVTANNKTAKENHDHSKSLEESQNDCDMSEVGEDIGDVSDIDSVEDIDEDKINPVDTIKTQTEDAQHETEPGTSSENIDDEASLALASILTSENIADGENYALDGISTSENIADGENFAFDGISTSVNMLVEVDEVGHDFPNPLIEEKQNSEEVKSLEESTIDSNETNTDGNEGSQNKTDKSSSGDEASISHIKKDSEEECIATSSDKTSEELQLKEANESSLLTSNENLTATEEKDLVKSCDSKSNNEENRSAKVDSSSASEKEKALDPYLKQNNITTTMEDQVSKSSNDSNTIENGTNINETSEDSVNVPKITKNSEEQTDKDEDNNSGDEEYILDLDIQGELLDEMENYSVENDVLSSPKKSSSSASTSQKPTSTEDTKDIPAEKTPEKITGDIKKKKKNGTALKDDALIYEGDCSDHEHLTEERIENQVLDNNDVEQCQKLNTSSSSVEIIDLGSSDEEEEVCAQKETVTKEMVALYQEKSIAQDVLDKEPEMVLGLNYLLEVRNNSCSYFICGICSKVLKSVILLLSHVRSVPHKLAFVRAHWPAFAEQFNAVPPKNWSSLQLKHFKAKITEQISMMPELKMAVVAEGQKTNALKIIKENIGRIEAFPATKKSPEGPYKTSLPSDEMRKALTNFMNKKKELFNTDEINIVKVQEQQQEALKQQVKPNNLDVLVVGDEWVQLWEDLNDCPGTPNIKYKEVYCIEDCLQEKLFRFANNKLRQCTNVLVVIISEQNLVYTKGPNNYLHVKSISSLETLKDNIKHTSSMWRKNYPNLKVVWVLPLCIDFQAVNQLKTTSPLASMSKYESNYVRHNSPQLTQVYKDRLMSLKRSLKSLDNPQCSFIDLNEIKALKPLTVTQHPDSVASGAAWDYVVKHIKGLYDDKPNKERMDSDSPDHIEASAQSSTYKRRRSSSSLDDSDDDFIEDISEDCLRKKMRTSGVNSLGENKMEVDGSNSVGHSVHSRLTGRSHRMPSSLQNRARVNAPQNDNNDDAVCTVSDVEYIEMEDEEKDASSNVKPHTDTPPCNPIIDISELPNESNTTEQMSRPPVSTSTHSKSKTKYKIVRLLKELTTYNEMEDVENFVTALFVAAAKAQMDNRKIIDTMRETKLIIAAKIVHHKLQTLTENIWTSTKVQKHKIMLSSEIAFTNLLADVVREVFRGINVFEISENTVGAPMQTVKFIVNQAIERVPQHSEFKSVLYNRVLEVIGSLRENSDKLSTKDKKQYNCQKKSENVRTSSGRKEPSKIRESFSEEASCSSYSHNTSKVRNSCGKEFKPFNTGRVKHEARNNSTYEHPQQSNLSCRSSEEAQNISSVRPRGILRNSTGKNSYSGNTQSNFRFSNVKTDHHEATQNYQHYENRRKDYYQRGAESNEEIRNSKRFDCGPYQAQPPYRGRDFNKYQKQSGPNDIPATSFDNNQRQYYPTNYPQEPSGSITSICNAFLRSNEDLHAAQNIAAENQQSLREIIENYGQELLQSNQYK